MMRIFLIFLAAWCFETDAQFFPRLPVKVPNVKPPVNVPGLKEATSLVGDTLQQWTEFKTKYNKQYSLTEEVQRQANFVKNIADITILNKDFLKNPVGALSLAINQFGDLLLDEFNSLVNGYNRKHKPRKPATSTLNAEPGVQIPENVDWREKGGVTAVKNQQQCAGCWAFASAGALEGHTFAKTGKLPEISVQNLIDCTKTKVYDNDGCDGGLIEPAYRYAKDTGVNAYESYPYQAKNSQCQFNKENIIATCIDYVDIPSGDEKALEFAVATVGPVATAIDANRTGIQFYKDGIFYDPGCEKQADKLNHAVLIVGYGKESGGGKYWLVKNSYGTTWGKDGYIKIAKDAGNMCGIATQATFPLVKKT